MFIFRLTCLVSVENRLMVALRLGYIRLLNSNLGEKRLLRVKRKNAGWHPCSSPVLLNFPTFNGLLMVRLFKGAVCTVQLITCLN